MDKNSINIIREWLLAEPNKLRRRYFRYMNKINVYDNLNLIYYSVSKVANTSIKYCLSNKAGMVDDLQDPQDIHTLLKENGVARISSPDNSNKFFKFSVVRNPFSRVVSCYKNKVKDTEMRQKDYDSYYFISKYPRLIYKGMSFEKFVSRIFRIPEYFAEKHFESQYNFLYKDGKCLVDYIGKLENIDEDFEYVRKKFDLDSLPKHNTTSNDNWRDYYSLETAEKVYKRYKKDFDTWYPNEYKKLLDYLKKGRIDYNIELNNKESNLNINKDVKIKVSVVMPAYNCERYIENSIKSVLDQTLREFELIIVDDYSNDNTVGIVEKYCSKDSRIKLIKSDENLGAGASRNKAFKKARGKYIALLDADDTCLPNRLEIQYEYLESNTSIYMVGTGSYDIDESGKKTRFYPIVNEEKLNSTMKEKNAVYGGSVMFRNTSEYLYREKFIYAQDYDFNLIILSDGKRIKNIIAPLYCYNIHSNSTSWGDVEKRIKQKLFAKLAKQYYHERMKRGKDSYEDFKIENIMNQQFDKESKEYLENEIELCQKNGKKYEARVALKKYIKNFGIINDKIKYIRPLYFGGRVNDTILHYFKKIKIIFYG